MRYKNFRKTFNICLLFWAIRFLGCSHYWLKDRSVLWKVGFQTNNNLEWHSEKNMENVELVGN